MYIKGIPEQPNKRCTALLFILYHVAQDCPHGVPAHVSSSKDAFQMTPWLAIHTDRLF